MKGVPTISNRFTRGSSRLLEIFLAHPPHSWCVWTARDSHKIIYTQTKRYITSPNNRCINWKATRYIYIEHRLIVSEYMWIFGCDFERHWKWLRVIFGTGKRPSPPLSQSRNQMKKKHKISDWMNDTCFYGAHHQPSPLINT